jgi:DNA-binding transcriptional LysR family regulator
MALDLRDIEVFLAVVRQGSFGRAATELVITQPAVSERVRHLERVIGGRLFERTSRGAVLTEPGEHLLPYAQRCIALAEEAVESARRVGGPPHLTVAVHSTFAQRIVPLVLGALAEVPRRVSVRDAHSHEVASLVLDGVADVGFVIPGPLHRSLRRVPLPADPVVGVVAPDHPLATRGRPSLSALRDAVLAINEWGDGCETFVTRLTDAGVDDWRVRRCADAATAIALARDYDHVAFVTSSTVAADLATKRLVRVPVAKMPPWTVRVELLHRKADGEDPAVRAITTAARGRMERVSSRR